MRGVDLVRTATRRVAALPLLFAILIQYGLSQPAYSQVPSQGEVGGLVTGLPVVPQQAPRPAEGSGAGEQWQTARPPGDNAPVASLFQPTKGNDSAFHVVLGQGRLLTTRKPIATENGSAVIAVGDPTVIDFQVLPDPRMIRVIGKRAGITDLFITTADGQVYSFEVHVGYDLQLLHVQLRQYFPFAQIKISQLGTHVVVEGQARSTEQVSQVIAMAEAYLESVQTVGTGGRGAAPASQPAPSGRDGNSGRPRAGMEASSGGSSRTQGSSAQPRVINLLRVPGVQQVMLKVQIAELDRTGLRQVGADILGVDPSTGNIFGTNIAGATLSAVAALGLGGLTGGATSNGISGTAFGIFPSGDFEMLLKLLRQNSLLSVMAEPNLVALNGYEASFLAGGEFPVPRSTGSGGTTSVSVEYKKFGVQLKFVPNILNDESVRLAIASEVSTIDESLGTTLVVGGDPIPGLNARQANTTVEMREGQTLAIAGLLSIEIDGHTSRIPGLGDLPYIGPMFSNTSHEKKEKELLILVTPYLVQPMKPCEVPPLPGSELKDPNDLEFFLMNRIEGRTGRDFRSTMSWQDPWNFRRMMKLERSCVCGPMGFSQ